MTNASPTPNPPMPPLRVALLSRWHVHADDYAREAREIRDIEIVTVWDEDPARGRAWAEELGVPFGSELDHVLGDDAVDAVIATPPTRDHRAILVEAADAGKHIFCEKVLAGTIEDADAILAAVEAAGVRLMLSLPRLTSGAYLAAQEAIDRGDLGRPVSVRCRVAHDGAVDREERAAWLPERFYDADAALGGALIDLGAHPIYLCNRIGGSPEAVTALQLEVTGRGVDDTSAALVRYASDVLGVVETGFANAGCPPLLEVHGTEGTFTAEDGRVRARRGREPWQERVEPAPLASPMRQWLAEIRDGTPTFLTRDDIRDLTRVNEAAARSAAEGRTVRLEDL